MIRKLLSHAAIYGLSAQVPRLAGVLALPIITPHLTTTDYGVAGVIMAVVSGLSFLQHLGLTVVIMNSYVKHPLRYIWIWRQINGFTTVWALAFGVILGMGIYIFAPDSARDNRLQLALLVALPAMFFANTDLLVNLYCQLSQQPLLLALKVFVVASLGVVLNIYFISYLKLGYMGWFYSNFIGTTVGFAISAYIAYVRQKLWPILNFKWSLIKGALRVSLPVIPHHMSFFLLDTSDKLVMTAVQVPIPQIGLYNVASNFGNYFQAASGAVVQAATPILREQYGRIGDISAAKQVRRITFFLAAVFLVITSLISLWMKEIFEVLIRNEELQQAYPLAIIILMGYNSKPMNLAVINLLLLREHTAKLWKVSFVAGAGNVVLNFLLVPVFGFQAAAFTTFAALMYVGYSGFYLKEYREAALVNFYPLLWLLLTVVALVVVYLLAAVLLYYKVLITIAASILLLPAFLLVKTRDLL